MTQRVIPSRAIYLPRCEIFAKSLLYWAKSHNFEQEQTKLCLCYKSNPIIFCQNGDGTMIRPYCCHSRRCAFCAGCYNRTSGYPDGKVTCGRVCLLNFPVVVNFLQRPKKQDRTVWPSSDFPVVAIKLHLPEKKQDKTVWPLSDFSGHCDFVATTGKKQDRTVWPSSDFSGRCDFIAPTGKNNGTDNQDSCQRHCCVV